MAQAQPADTAAKEHVVHIHPLAPHPRAVSTAGVCTLTTRSPAGHRPVRGSPARKAGLSESSPAGSRGELSRLIDAGSTVAPPPAIPGPSRPGGAAEQVPAGSTAQVDQQAHPAHCHDPGDRNLALYLEGPEWFPGHRARMADPHPCAAARRGSRADLNPAPAQLPVRCRPASQHLPGTAGLAGKLALRVLAGLQRGGHLPPACLGVLLPDTCGAGPASHHQDEHGPGDQENQEQASQYGRFDAVNAPPQRVAVPARASWTCAAAA